MRYLREIQERNVQAHLDIESDIQVKKNGLFTFVLRVNNGNIVDYSVLEYVNGEKYDGLAQSIIEELTAAYNHQQGDQRNAVRPNNGQR